MVSSFKDLSDLLDEKIKYSEYLECTSQVQGKTEKGLTIETISNILNLENVPTKQLEGNLLVGITGFKRFFTFDNSTIQKLPVLLKELTRELQNGKTFNYQKFFNEYSITIGLPTATGFPLVYTLNTPTLLSAKGKFKVQVMGEERKENDVFVLPDALNATTEMVFEYSTRTQSKISFLTPFSHKRYVAGYDKNTQLELPVKKQFDLDLKNRHVKVQLMPLKENVKTKLFHYSTWPYVAVDNILEFKPLAESSKIYRVQTRQPQKYQHLLGDKEVGVVFSVEGESDKEYTNLGKFYQRFLKQGFVPALLASVTSEKIEQTTVDLYYDGEKSTAKSVVLTASYEYSPTEQTTSGTQGGENKATTTIKTVDSQTRKQEFLKKVKQGIKSSSAVVVDLGLQVLGKTNAEYLTTVALATSPVDPLTRILTFARKNVNNKKFEVCFDAVSRIPKVSTVDFTKVLQNDLKGEIEGKLLFGEECQSGSVITIVGDLKRSQERKEYLEKQPLVQQAKKESVSGYKLQPSQEQVLKEVGLFDDYVFTVKYENVPEDVKNMTYQTYSVLRYLGYPYLSENLVSQTKAQPGQLELGVNLTPDLKALNVYVYSPLGDSRFENILLNDYVSKGLTLHPMHSTIERIADVALNEKYGGAQIF